MHVVEYRERFETGRPVTVHFVRGTRASPMPAPGGPDHYQQRLEPAGRYMVHNPNPGALPPGWEKGVVRFESPLVLPLNTVPGGPIYDEHSWKVALQAEFGGKTGRALSLAILRAGYDAVVTVALGQGGRPIDTREIVDLTGLHGRRMTARDIIQGGRRGR